MLVSGKDGQRVVAHIHIDACFQYLHGVQNRVMGDIKTWPIYGQRLSLHKFF